MSRSKNASSLGSSEKPFLVEVIRGETVESRHRGALAVCDPEGRLVARWGDVECPVFPRSAVKPLQALPLVESGAAERYGLGCAELALSAGSHGGEPGHILVLQRWMERVGLTLDDLECGAHLPLSEEAAKAVLCSETPPSALHNNCSGQHLGFLTTARHLGERTRGYIAPEHPVQRRVIEAIAALTGLDLARAPRGIDGCGIPTLGLPLRGLALAMARLARPSALEASRAAAIGRITAAMAAEPLMVAGRGRICTTLIEASKGAVLVKGGAEGVFAAALPRLGLGFALKIEDGAARAAEVACATLLTALGVFEGEALRAISPLAERPLLDRSGRRVGVIRVAQGWPAGGREPPRPARP